MRVVRILAAGLAVTAVGTVWLTFHTGWRQAIDAWLSWLIAAAAVAWCYRRVRAE